MRYTAATGDPGEMISDKDSRWDRRNDWIVYRLYDVQRRR
jgi:hypothetical protein